MLRCVKLWAKRRGVYSNVSICCLLVFPIHAFLFCVMWAFLGMSLFSEWWIRVFLWWLQLLGFLGGVHLAILAAFVCQKHPNASLNTLIVNFFQTFAFWPWPAPVILQDGMLPTGDATETRSLMPIRLPCSPHEYCHSNITRSTFYRIRAEFLQGYAMTRVCFVV